MRFNQTTFNWAFLCCNSCSSFSLRSWRLVDSRWALRYRFSRVAIRSSWSSFCAAFSRRSLCNLRPASCAFRRSFCVFDSVSSNSATRPLSSATRRCHVLNSELYNNICNTLIIPIVKETALNSSCRDRKICNPRYAKLFVIIKSYDNYSIWRYKTNSGRFLMCVYL